MVCRACKIQTYVTSSQAVAYVVGTLCFVIFVLLGIWLNHTVRKRQKRFLEYTRVSSLWGEEDAEGHRNHALRPLGNKKKKNKKHNDFTQLDEDNTHDDNVIITPVSSSPSPPQPQQQTTVLNMKGAEFLHGVTTFAHQSSV
jgi:hypothetical protein